MNRRRKNVKANPCNAFGIQGPGGNGVAAVVDAACVSMVLMAVHSQHRCGTAPYHDSFRYGTVWYQVLARVETTLVRQKEAPWRRPSRKMRPRLGVRPSPVTLTRFGSDCSTASRPRSPSAD